MYIPISVISHNYNGKFLAHYSSNIYIYTHIYMPPAAVCSGRRRRIRGGAGDVWRRGDRDGGGEGGGRGEAGAVPGGEDFPLLRAKPAEFSVFGAGSGRGSCLGRH